MNTREEFEKEYGQVWDTEQLKNDFMVLSFLAPFVMVKRKDNNELGTLSFNHSPRFYFNYVKDGR